MNKMKMVVAAFAVAILAAGCAKINPGEVGIETVWGKITSEEVLKEGLHFRWPIAGDIVKYDTKNQIVRYHSQQYTKDIQEATIEAMITYSLDASAVIDTHKKTGIKYKEKLIFPAIHGAVKNVLGKWDAVTVINKREEATDLIEKTLDSKLNSFGIKITLVEIADISFKDKFEEAVEAKQIAEQEANRAKNLTVKIDEEAKQRVIAAKAEAEAMRIKAEALEKNKSLVEYEAVLRWDGKLPTYMMGGVVPFMNITPEKK